MLFNETGPRNVILLINEEKERMGETEETEIQQSLSHAQTLHRVGYQARRSQGPVPKRKTEGQEKQRSSLPGQQLLAQTLNQQ